MSDPCKRNLSYREDWLWFLRLIVFDAKNKSFYFSLRLFVLFLAVFVCLCVCFLLIPSLVLFCSIFFCHVSFQFYLFCLAFVVLFRLVLSPPCSFGWVFSFFNLSALPLSHINTRFYDHFQIKWNKLLFARSLSSKGNC